MIHHISTTVKVFVLVSLLVTKFSHASLSVPIDIKEVQGVGSQEYPVSVVVPLPYGEFQSTESLGILDNAGVEIPSAIKVLNRWWAKDNSIRHIEVFLQPEVGAYSTAGTGITTVFLTKFVSTNSSVQRIKHRSPIVVVDAPSQISVDTGPLQFTVSKDQFNLIENVVLNNVEMLLDDAQHAVFTDNTNSKKYDKDRQDVKVILEEHNDLRTVIRAESRSSFNNGHERGFAVRIYAYAGKEYVKIDYQLQNSPIDSQFAGPLYFEALDLNFNIAIQGERKTRVGLENGDVYTTLSDNGVSLKQTSHDEFLLKVGEQPITAGSQATGFISVSGQNGGVMATTRNFWQMWPNGLATSSNNTLQIQLYPDWSAQWHEQQVSPTGLYWLDDMQHVYKEVLIYFHGADATDEHLTKIAQTFAFPPVGTVEPSWYAETKATLDLGGYVSTNIPVSDDSSRTVSYSDIALDRSNTRYNFNVENFLIDTYRKRAHQTPGNYPYSGSAYIASRNPKDLYMASQRAIGELNVRPQWLAGYKHSEHYDLIQPTSNPYGGISWRRFVNHNTSHLAKPYIDGTSQDSAPRGDSHGWFYHIEDTYYFTGNLWIKDWYEFIAQFRRTRLFQLDPYPNMVSRAQAHSLSNALQAYKVTGDVAFLNQLVDYVWTYIEPTQKQRRTGALGSKEAAFQLGFATRFLINLYNEINDTDTKTKQRLFNIISGNVQWNVTYSNYSYYITAEDGVSYSSSGSGASFVDPQAWYTIQTGNKAYLEHILDYTDDGINGGTRAYEQLRTPWAGDFYGRLSQVAREYSSSLSQPAPPVVDLSLSQHQGEVSVAFSLPEQAQRFFLLASAKPFSETQTLNPAVTNWWAGNVVATSAEGSVSGLVNVNFNARNVGELYVIAFYTDAQGRLSAMSNQANVFVDTIDNDNGEIESTLLVDFGSSEQLNAFGIENWNEVISDVYNDYIDNGLTISIGSNGSYNYQGVMGTARHFDVGQVIVVTWKNVSNEVKSFIPIISFEDTDRPISGETGDWYNMSAVKVAPGESTISVFLIDEQTAGTYSVVNTSVNTNHNKALIADKINIFEENPLRGEMGENEPFLFDFIKSKVSEIFSMPGWFTVSLDAYTELGEFGTSADRGQNNFQTISGPSVLVDANMRMVTHWKNIGPYSIEFTPYISFDDSDRRFSGMSGQWYPMNTTLITPNSTGTTSFDMSSLQLDSLTMVNISNNKDSERNLVLTGIQVVGIDGVVFGEDQN